jgi:hypothetical protein
MHMIQVRETSKSQWTNCEEVSDEEAPALRKQFSELSWALGWSKLRVTRIVYDEAPRSA